MSINRDGIKKTPLNNSYHTPAERNAARHATKNGQIRAKQRRLVKRLEKISTEGEQVALSAETVELKWICKNCLGSGDMTTTSKRLVNDAACPECLSTDVRLMFKI